MSEEESGSKGFEQWETNLARRMVHEYRRKSRALGRELPEDLEQECLLHWFTVKSRVVLVPGKPARAYMASVLRHWLIDMAIRAETARRRGAIGALSLDAPLSGSDDEHTLLSELAEQPANGFADQVLARLDIASVMPQLTPLQQRLCALLGPEGLTLAEAARRLGMARSTAYDETLRIRRCFEAFGLLAYLRS